MINVGFCTPTASLLSVFAILFTSLLLHSHKWEKEVFRACRSGKNPDNSKLIIVKYRIVFVTQVDCLEWGEKIRFSGSERVIANGLTRRISEKVHLFSSNSSVWSKIQFSGSKLPKSWG